MSNELETIKVKCEESDCGWKIINKKDMKSIDIEYKAKKRRKPKKLDKEN